MKILLLLALSSISIASCVPNYKPTPSSPATNTSGPASTPVPTPKSYGFDLVGQSVRIKDEGINDETVKENISEIDKTITYELLKKSPDKYVGRPWGFKGRILETAEKDGSTVARIGLGAYGSNAVYVIGPIETRFVENDQVFVVGYVASPFTYTSQANWTISVPALAMRAMMSPKEVAKYETRKK